MSNRVIQVVIFLSCCVLILIVLYSSQIEHKARSPKQLVEFQTRPTTQLPINRKDKEFIIRHSGNKCVSIDSTDRLFLIASCTTKFTLTNDTVLREVASGKCVVPESASNGAKLKLQRHCHGNNARFEQTKKFSIKHISSGKCWHPEGGNTVPDEGTRAIIYSGCDSNVLVFKLTKEIATMPTFYIPFENVVLTDKLEYYKDQVISERRATIVNGAKIRETANRGNVVLLRKINASIFFTRPGGPAMCLRMPEESTTISITAWINIKHLPTAKQHYSSIFISGRLPYPGYHFFINGTQLSATVASVRNYASISTDFGNYFKKWTHVAMTYSADGDKSRLFINGELHNETRGGGSKSTKGSRIVAYIGYCEEYGENNLYYYMMIDDMAIFCDHALTDTQIRFIYNYD